MFLWDLCGICRPNSWMQVMTKVAARFAAPWGHHDPQRLRRDLLKAEMSEGFTMGESLGFKPCPYSIVTLNGVVSPFGQGMMIQLFFNWVDGRGRGKMWWLNLFTRHFFVERTGMFSGMFWRLGFLKRDRTCGTKILERAFVSDFSKRGRWNSAFKQMFVRLQLPIFPKLNGWNSRSWKKP